MICLGLLRGGAVPGLIKKVGSWGGQEVKLPEGIPDVFYIIFCLERNTDLRKSGMEMPSSPYGTAQDWKVCLARLISL